MKSLNDLSRESGILRKKLYNLAKRKYPQRFCNGMKTLFTDEEGMHIIEERDMKLNLHLKQNYGRIGYSNKEENGP